MARPAAAQGQEGGNEPEPERPPGVTAVPDEEAIETELKELILAKYGARLLSCQDANGGRVPQGYTKALLTGIQRIAPGIKRDDINDWVRREKKVREKAQRQQQQQQQQSEVEEAQDEVEDVEVVDAAALGSGSGTIDGGGHRGEEANNATDYEKMRAVSPHPPSSTGSTGVPSTECSSSSTEKMDVDGSHSSNDLGLTIVSTTGPPTPRRSSAASSLPQLPLPPPPLPSPSSASPVVLERNSHGQFDTELCSFCAKNRSGHRCTAKYENFGHFQLEGEFICGMVFCHECKLDWGSENPARCRSHLGVKKDDYVQESAPKILASADAAHPRSQPPPSPPPPPPPNLPPLLPPPPADDGDDSNEVAQPQTKKRKRAPGGRPKGSTDEAKRKQKEKITTATNEVSVAYGKHLNERKAAGRTAERGYFDKLVAAARTKHGLTEEQFDPLQETIKQRHNRNPANMAVAHRGTPSPMEEVEPYLVQMIIKLCEICRTITKDELLLLANSIIKGTVYEDRVIAFKTKHSHYDDGDELLGRGWYEGFMGRNAHVLQSSYGIKFSVHRADWCNWANVLYMYDKVYEKLTEAKIAKMMDEEVWLDRQGNIVEEGSDQVYGLPTRFKIVRPDMLFFFDETGINTNQLDDSNNAGEKLVHGKGQKARRVAASNNNRATLLPFTAATGEAVGFAVIFAAESVHTDWQLGDDIRVPIFGEVTEGSYDIAQNTGPGLRHPGGPRGHFRGKDVPCVSAASPKGSITPEILVAVFDHFERLGLFPRDDGVKPCFVCDSHGSRFSEIFLKRINDPTRPYVGCVGVPYFTHGYQVGDASEQNGCFKSDWYREKDALTQWKAQNGYQLSITKTDIMPLLNRAVKKSFLDAEKAKKAIADRGWTPLNYACLTLPEVLVTKPSESATAQAAAAATAPLAGATGTIAPPESLNTTSGYSQQLLDCLVDHHNSNSGRERRRLEAAEERRNNQAASESFREQTKGLKGGVGVPTGGSWYESGNVALDGDALEMVQAKADAEKKKENDKEEKNRRELRELKGRVDAIVAKTRIGGTRTVEETKDLIKFKKKGPGWVNRPAGVPNKIPTGKDEANRIWELVKNLPDPAVTPASSTTTNTAAAHAPAAAPAPVVEAAPARSLNNAAATAAIPHLPPLPPAAGVAAPASAVAAMPTPAGGSAAYPFAIAPHVSQYQAAAPAPIAAVAPPPAAATAAAPYQYGGGYNQYGMPLSHSSQHDPHPHHPYPYVGGGYYTGAATAAAHASTLMYHDDDEEEGYAGAEAV